MDKNKFKLHIEDFFDINSNCNIYCYDLENRLFNANDHMLTMIKSTFGYKPNKPLNSINIADISSDFDILVEENRRVIESGKAHQYYNRTMLNGNSLLFVTIKAPLYDENNNIVGVFGISHLLSSYNIAGKIYEKLSQREYECLIELVKGKSAAEIGESLNLSKRTVESYLDNIKTKLACRTKSDLINKVYDLGLTTLTDETTSESFKGGMFLPQDFGKKE